MVDLTDPLIATDELASRLAEVQIVDATLYMPGDNRPGRAEFETAHIPGAIFFDIEDISDHDTDLPHMLPDIDTLARQVGDLGLRRDATVVVYDQGLFSAPRVWWMLRLMGFPDVRVLDGGLAKWRAEARPVEQGAGAAPTAADLEPALDGTLVRDREQVSAALASGAEQVIDARAAGRFRGEAPEPRAGLASGHMPGALNVPWNAVANAEGTFKSATEIRAAFERAGADLGRPIVTSCGSGVTAAILTLALARAGVRDVAIYDGSWTEWASRDMPIATGA